MFTKQKNENIINRYPQIPIRRHCKKCNTYTVHSWKTEITHDFVWHRNFLSCDRCGEEVVSGPWVAYD